MCLVILFALIAMRALELVHCRRMTRGEVAAFEADMVGQNVSSAGNETESASSFGSNDLRLDSNPFVICYSNDHMQVAMLAWLNIACVLILLPLGLLISTCRRVRYVLEKRPPASESGKVDWRTWRPHTRWRRAVVCLTQCAWCLDDVEFDDVEEDDDRSRGSCLSMRKLFRRDRRRSRAAGEPPNARTARVHRAATMAGSSSGIHAADSSRRPSRVVTPNPLHRSGRGTEATQAGVVDVGSSVADSSRRRSETVVWRPSAHSSSWAVDTAIAGRIPKGFAPILSSGYRPTFFFLRPLDMGLLAFLGGLAVFRGSLRGTAGEQVVVAVLCTLLLGQSVFILLAAPYSGYMEWKMPVKEGSLWVGALAVFVNHLHNIHQERPDTRWLSKSGLERLSIALVLAASLLFVILFVGFWVVLFRGAREEEKTITAKRSKTGGVPDRYRMLGVSWDVVASSCWSRVSALCRCWKSRCDTSTVRTSRKEDGSLQDASPLAAGSGVVNPLLASCALPRSRGSGRALLRGNGDQPVKSYRGSFARDNRRAFGPALSRSATHQGSSNGREQQHGQAI